MAVTKKELRTLERYEIDTLGAPFKVTLHDSVSASVNPKTGEEKINVPDVVGLIGAVVRKRVSHPRKLNGEEIRFVRNALGLKAKPLSKFLNMTPEHFSRCEAGTKVMAVMSEKFFRLFACLATHFSDPHDLLARMMEGHPDLETVEFEKSAKKPDAMAKEFVEQFLNLKIESVYDASEELSFDLRRIHTEDDVEDDEGEWEFEQAHEPVAAVG